MAVPTIYAKLIAHLEEQFDSTDMMQSFDYVKATCTNNFRFACFYSYRIYSYISPWAYKWKSVVLGYFYKLIAFRLLAYIRTFAPGGL